jgi:hypothetical protein
MEFKMIITPKGTVVSEVMDRGQHLCSEVYRVTNAVGTQLSDEETGPDQEPVIETAGER